MNPRTKDGREIHWPNAEDSARRLARICESAQFVPPEAGDVHQVHLNRAAVLLGEVSDALRMSKQELSPAVIDGLVATTPEAKEWLAVMAAKAGMSVREVSS